MVTSLSQAPRWHSGNTLIFYLWGRLFKPRGSYMGKVDSCLLEVSSLQNLDQPYVLVCSAYATTRCDMTCTMCWKRRKTPYKFINTQLSDRWLRVLIQVMVTVWDALRDCLILNFVFYWELSWLLLHLNSQALDINVLILCIVKRCYKNSSIWE